MSGSACGRRLPARALTLVLHDGRAPGEYPMPRDSEGVFDRDRRRGGRRATATAIGSTAVPLGPIPASRFQPDGVHGPSQIVDPGAFAWTDRRWGGRDARGSRPLRAPRRNVHAGGHVRRRRGEARDAAGSRASPSIELMPVADFPGARNWGYDGVCLFAPSRAYGQPDDLRRLVDRAHQLGLGVMLDVVYNHLGPEGAYLPEFSRRYFTSGQHTVGTAVNLDGDGSPMVRRFIVDNALHWIREYHVDGLRLDATHALVDRRTPDRSCARSRAAVHAALGPAGLRLCGGPSQPGRDDRRPGQADGGSTAYGPTTSTTSSAVSSRATAHGYYADFAGTTEELAAISRAAGCTRAASPQLGRPRGTDPSARLPMHRFVSVSEPRPGRQPCAGDRLHHAIAGRGVARRGVLLLTAPMTPLLFMGQEWAAGTPFQSFTDLEPGSGSSVTEAGRNGSSLSFPEFSGRGVAIASPIRSRARHSKVPV